MLIAQGLWHHRDKTRSDVETEMNHISVLDDVVLALEAQLAAISAGAGQAEATVEQARAVIQERRSALSL